MISNVTHRICKNQANLFVLSAERGLDSRIFVDSFMNSKTAAKMDGVYDRNQWMGAEYTLEDFSFEINVPQGRIINPDALHWIGYITRYWQQARDISSKEIWAMTGMDHMLACWTGYHTISFNEALERLENYAGKSKSFPRISEHECRFPAM